VETSEKERGQRHWIIRLLSSKTLIITAALVVTYTLIGFFLSPYLMHRYAVKFAEEKLKCQLSIKKIRMNPYALTLDIENLDLKEKNGSPLLAFDRFFVNLQTSSLWRWALTFADVRLEKPSVAIEVMPDHRINLIALLDRIPRDDAEADKGNQENRGDIEPPPRVIVDHIAVKEGRIGFADLSDPTPGRVTLAPINLELNNFTTLPDQKGVHSFEATLPQGGRLRWAGEISVHPLRSQGTIDIKDFKVATVWEFLQDEIRLERPAGAVDLSAGYHFAHGRTSDSLLVEGIKVVISGLFISRAGTKDPIFTMDAIRLDGGRFDRSSREVSVGHLAFSRGSVAAAVDEEGRLSFQELVAAKAKDMPAPTVEEKRDQPPWRIDVKRIGLEDVAVKYIDRSRAYPTEMGANLGMELTAHLTYVPEKTQAIVEDGDITLSEASLKEIGNDDPLVILKKLVVQGARLDLDARQLGMERLAVEGGHARVLKEREGAINLVRVLSGGGTGKVQKEVTSIAEEARQDAKPWAVAVGSVELSRFDVAFSDQGLAPSPSLDLENLRLKVSNIKSDLKTPLPFETTLTVKQGGGMSARGRIHVAEKNAEAAIQVSKLSLTPFQPYVGQMVLLTVDSGTLSLEGNVAYRKGKGGPSTTFAGSVELDDLHMSEEATDQRFLSWKKMAVNDIRLGLAPDRLEIGEVRLKEPYGKLIIYEDQSVSLKKVLRPQVKKPEPIKSPPQKERPGGFPVTVKKIQIDRGGLDFADLSLTPQFAAKIHELKGSIVGLSTQPDQRAQVQLDGRVDAYGSSKIRGELEPFNAKHFTDISVVFRNVEMTNLTPYSARFAGYRIASGKLSLDLRYLIKDSALQGENQIILDKMTLGEKVDNPDAPDLPLELALALLRDSEDRIDIGLPVSGNLDDPQFSYGHLIWKALLNLFKKIVTAPFRALGAMLGIDDNQLDTIAFEPGKALLSPPEQEKVKTLSEALARRPQLTLKMQGGYDPSLDGAALRSFAVRAEIAKRAGKKALSDEEPEPVDVGDPLVQKAIDDLVKERMSPQVLASAKEEASKRTAEASKKGDKPSSEALPAEVTRDLYTTLLQKLLDAYPVAEARLKELGQQRAEEIKRALVKTGQVRDTRVGILESAAAEEAGKEGIGSKLTLDVVK